jgi:type I restriction enzyme, S subunit
MKLKAFFEKFDQFADAPDAVVKMRELVLGLAASGRLLPRKGEWETRPLKSLATKIGSGATPAGGRESYFSKGIPLIRSMNVHFRGFNRTGLVFLNDEQAEELSNVVVQSNDVLLNITGASIGRVTIAPVEMSGARVNQHVTIIRPTTELFPRFLAIFLSSPLVQRMINDTQVGATRQALTKAMIERFHIPLPPLTEQKRIAGKVDELMALCDRLEAQQQERETRSAVLARASVARFAEAPTPGNLGFLFHKSYTISPADLRKSILTLAVQGKLVRQDPNDEPATELLKRVSRELSAEKRPRQAAPLATLPAESMQYEVPDSWMWARFRDVAIIASNLVKPDAFLDFAHLAPDNVEKGNGKLLPCATVRQDKVISSNHRFYPGQIVYSKIRPNLAKVVVVDFNGLCSADMYPIDALIDASYLHRYMLSEPFLVQAVKAETRVAMPKINQTELNALAVPVPPLAEQRRIVAKVDRLMALVDKLETQLAASRATGEKLMEAVVAELTALETTPPKVVGNATRRLRRHRRATGQSLAPQNLGSPTS